MNKVTSIFLIICAFAISVVLVILESTSYVYYDARNVYRVYLNGESLGLIEKKEDLENYINQKQEAIKNRYKVKNVYIPNGLKIESETTYSEKTESVESIYDKISKEEDFTINGYTVTISDIKTTKNKDNDEKKTEKIKEYIYLLDKKTLEPAINEVVKSFVNEKQYQDYLNEIKKDKTNLGTIIENVYLKEQISIKKGKIPANSEIYSNSQDLAKYLLFGTNKKTKTYKVKSGDNVKNIAYNNKMSTTELLIANRDISDENSLLYPGQEVVISYINPVITVIEETHSVKKESIRYKTKEEKDNSMYAGTSKVTQSGKKGLSKITRKIEKQNGKITQALIVNTEVLRDPVTKIVKVGTKETSSSGGSYYTGPVGPIILSGDWAWPTVSNYTITEYWGYGLRSDIGESSSRMHDGIDIAGLGCGSPIYAANNGRVKYASWYPGYGNYIEIDHGNGIITFYGHLNAIYVSAGQSVSRGQRIAAMGNTGYSFGCHLHYGMKSNGSSANPLSLYS